MRPPYRVLFVCTANIARSPYLERRAQTLVSPEVAEFASGGTHNHPGRPVDPYMARLLADRGGNPYGHSSQPVSPVLLAWADMVLTASAEQRHELLERRIDLAQKIFTLAQFVVAGETAQPTTELIKDAFKLRGGTPPELDLVDPYGRGAEAARNCADIADGYLQRLAALLNSAATDSPATEHPRA